MATQTPNYGFDLPTEGGDNDNWGGFLNGNWAALDATLKEISDKADAAEALAESLKIKIGDLYLSTDAADPATKLGYGEWAAHAEGRALVGVGNNGEIDWLPDMTGGEDTRTLTVDNLPAHGHGVSITSDIESAGHTHSWSDTSDAKGWSAVTTRTEGSSAGNRTVVTGLTGTHSHAVGGTTSDRSANHTHGVNGNTQNTGGGQSFDNRQHSIAVYVWKRTA